VAVAHDGQEAVDYLLDSGNALPAFVLLDLEIPKISGLEVLRQVRVNARTRLNPVVLLTSSTQDPDLRASYVLGGNSYVVKSVDFEMFTMESAWWCTIGAKSTSSRPQMPERPRIRRRGDRAGTKAPLDCHRPPSSRTLARPILPAGMIAATQAAPPDQAGRRIEFGVLRPMQSGFPRTLRCRGAPRDSNMPINLRQPNDGMP
jgi:CheY-like chemotaxis protein